MRILFIFALSAAIILSLDTTAQADKGSGIVCSNKYVLCTSAPCVPDPSNLGSKAICKCDVNSGKNYGMSPCDARTPATDSTGVTKALSTYSFVQAPYKPVLTCPAGKPWTDCLDQPCIVDPMNPLKAICTCKIKREEPYVTYGGGCNVLSCDNAYWSGATLEAFNQGSIELVKAMGLKSVPTKFCPGMNPESSK